MPIGVYPRTKKHLQLLAEARKKITPESLLRMSQSRRGVSAWNKGKPSPLRGTTLSKETREKIRVKATGRKHTEATKEKIRQVNLGTKRPLCCGELHPFWKGGVTPVYKKIRKSPEYIVWRKAVFERDNYTCVHCGVVGGNLNADHIKPFSLYPELRFDVSNGRTLCVPCHKQTDSYGGATAKGKTYKRSKKLS